MGFGSRQDLKIDPAGNLSIGGNSVVNGLCEKDYIQYGFQNANTTTTFTSAQQYQPVITPTQLSTQNNFVWNGGTNVTFNNALLTAPKLFLVNMHVTWSIQLNAPAKLCGLSIQKNGLNIPATLIASRVDDAIQNHPQAVSSSAIVSLNNGDVIQPAVANLEDTVGIVVNYLVITISEL